MNDGKRKRSTLVSVVRQNSMREGEKEESLSNRVHSFRSHSGAKSLIDIIHVSCTGKSCSESERTQVNNSRNQIHQR